MIVNYYREIMKKLFQCVGTLIYSVIASYLLWLLFYWVTPYIMGMGWLMFFLYIFLAGGAVTMIVSLINGLLAVPMVFLMKNNNVAKVINALPMLFHGYSAVCIPWGLNMEYGVLQYFLGISLTIMVLVLFVAMIMAPYKIEDE